MCAAPLRLGLTATPDRADGRHVDLDPTDRPGGLPPGNRGTPAAKRWPISYVVRVPVKLKRSGAVQIRPGVQKHCRHFSSRRINCFKANVPEGVKAATYDWRDLCAESGKDPAARAAQAGVSFQGSRSRTGAAEKLRVLEDLFRLHAGQRVIVFAGSNAMAIDVSRRVSSADATGPLPQKRNGLKCWRVSRPASFPCWSPTRCSTKA